MMINAERVATPTNRLEQLTTNLNPLQRSLFADWMRRADSPITVDQSKTEIRNLLLEGRNPGNAETYQAIFLGLQIAGMEMAGQVIDGSAEAEEEESRKFADVVGDLMKTDMHAAQRLLETKQRVDDAEDQATADLQTRFDEQIEKTKKLRQKEKEDSVNQKNELREQNIARLLLSGHTRSEAETLVT